jgi:threonylcarbamoyladenosine tRNA methylthiotransferase MtaB
MYRARALEIAEKFDFLGLGADIITGFPGETDEDHSATVALVEELPFTYLHVFPFSPREGTVAADLVKEMPVPQRVAGERARELRELVQSKGEAYRRRRAGTRARVVLEGKGRSALTEDYLRVGVRGPLPEDRRVIHEVELAMVDGELSAVFGTD